ncbi:hypothetical protein UK23_23165 [Lentzea aerocolonigenes]|uniref:Uncharacterized protein n=1 Tax=Lentzea aerocolonigenes TaxID=68170 RepID=A0A0F0GTA7_LENAE|nr:hypothetical protein [Lentzea aerocolonigenes]KJK46505.1 hypothetical protein UK23_23165 [Lentzea aerocolonigenes]
MWGRRSAARRLAESAGFSWKNIGDQSELSVAKMAAYVAANRAMPDDVLPTVGRVAEKLAAEEANYELVVALVEDLQNLVSHGLGHLRTAEEVRSVLGPQCLVVWEAVEKFWARVAEWRRGTGEPLRSSADILSVENEQLRATLWTSNRSLGDDTRVGTAEALRYEKAGGIEIPGYRELLAP